MSEIQRWGLSSMTVSTKWLGQLVWVKSKTGVWGKWEDVENLPGAVEDYTRRLNEQLKAQYHKDRDHIDKLEDANGQLCFNLDEARQVVEARDDQAAIDKDFIRQYQEQVEELQDALKSISEAASHGNLYHIDAPDNCAKIAGIAQGLLAQPQESDK